MHHVLRLASVLKTNGYGVSSVTFSRGKLVMGFRKASTASASEQGFFFMAKHGTVEVSKAAARNANTMRPSSVIGNNEVAKKSEQGSLWCQRERERALVHASSNSIETLATSPTTTEAYACGLKLKAWAAFLVLNAGLDFSQHFSATLPYCSLP
ncbi:hypothetical protein V6N13_084564 [Hibiscus sabdariffa]